MYVCLLQARVLVVVALSGWAAGSAERRDVTA